MVRLVVLNDGDTWEEIAPESQRIVEVSEKTYRLLRRGDADFSHLSARQIHLVTTLDKVS